MHETRARSIVKGISWRTVATLTTMFLVLIFTGKIYLAAGIGAFEVVSKLLIYYVHERAWNKITWGRI
ncbi:DUF2061 domain-containing protein [Candidatus Woesearchaeota archaeon]|nr:DUF2061 domain-containing protein [Candidatus Woesearchaeota archaeon]